MKYKVRTTGATVELNDNNFKAKGGEGSIYIVGDTVYKVCDPGKMIADGKFKELAALDHMRIIRPDDVLLDSKSKPTGYTMKVVPGNPLPLAKILSKTYREREGVTPDMMAELVSQISEGIRYIHKKPGYLQVDGNELNYMVTNNHKDIYFIDVNSYQTPNFPADAIMPSIRDWNAGTNFTQLTDWYSFAIISFYMFTGIHPFKGMHPNFTNLKTSMIERMQVGISVLDKNTQFPQAAVYFPFEAVIPWW
jgi:serine/threonine protein kinase